MRQIRASGAEEQITAQQHIDEVMMLEIELAEELAEAESKAEEAISRASEDIEKIKREIVAQARQERDNLLENGLAAAQGAAQESEQKALANAQALSAAGGRFVDEAAIRVVERILPSQPGRTA